MLPTFVQAVEYAARVAATCQTIEKGRQELMALGIGEDLSARLLFIVPHAFGALFYERQGIVFCQTFLDGPAGYDTERKFVDEPILPVAIELGKRWIDSDESVLFHSACDWSAQVAVARARLKRGLPLDDLSKPPRFLYLVIPWYGGPPRRPSDA
jgi:hypothetical protein